MTWHSNLVDRIVGRKTNVRQETVGVVITVTSSNFKSKRLNKPTLRFNNFFNSLSFYMTSW